jgi:hypothetical protein
MPWKRVDASPCGFEPRPPHQQLSASCVKCILPSPDSINCGCPLRVKSGRAVVYLHRRWRGGCPCLDSDLDFFASRVRYCSLRAKGRGSRRQARTHKEDGQAAVHPRLRNAWLWSGVWIGNHCCRFLRPQLSRLGRSVREVRVLLLVLWLVPRGEDVERSLSRSSSVPTQLRTAEVKAPYC